MGGDPYERFAPPANEIGEHRLDRALAGAEALDPPETDRSGPGEQAEDRRADGRLPHRDHLARHARKGKDPRCAGGARPGEIEIDAGGRPFGVGDDPAAAGKERLPAVRFGHRGSAAGKPGFDVGQRPLRELQGHLGHPGEDIPGEIVRGRAEAPGDDNHIGPFPRDAEGGDPVLETVGDRRVEGDRHAEQAELTGEPLAVRVEALPGRQFVADRDDLRAEAPRRGPAIPFVRPGRCSHQRLHAQSGFISRRGTVTTGHFPRCGEQLQR